MKLRFSQNGRKVIMKVIMAGALMVGATT